MALQKQVLSVPFAKALDTKTDPKQVVIGKFLTLENGIFTSPGRIRKRNGYAQLNNQIEGTLAPLTTGAGLANFKNEILNLTGTEVYSFSDSTAKWTDKQTLTNMQLSSAQVVRNTYQQTVPDVAIHPEGLEVVTYEDSRGGSRYCLIDSETGEQVVSDQLILSTAIKPKPFVMGNFLVIMFIDTALNHLRCLPIPVLTPLSPFPLKDLALNVSFTHPNYDANLYSTHLYFTYNTNSNSITINSMNFFLVLGAPETVLGESASSCIALTVDTVNGEVWVAYHNGTQVKYFVFNNTLPFTPALPPTLISANSNTILNIALIAFNGTAQVYYTQTAILPSNDFILHSTLTDTGTVISPTVFIRSVSIAGKVFTFNTTNYITVAFDSQLQPTYFVLRTSDASVIAKFSPGLGGGTPVRNIIPETPMSDYGIYLIAQRQKDLLTTISGAVYTQTGVNVITLDFINAHISKVELGGNTHFTGGILSMYDGVSVVEHGFNIFPENITYAQSPTGGGIGPGTYEYFEVYSWMDGQGQTNYSAPSVGVQVVVPVPTSPLTFTATFTSGQQTLIPVSSIAGLVIGQVITDSTTPTNLDSGTYITAIGAGTINISQPTLAASGTPDTLQTTYTASVTATIPTLRLTQKKAPIRGPVIIQTYRTEDSQTIGYLVSSVLSPTLNDTTIDSVSFTDTLPDAEILGNPTLYTTGGVIENIAAPACSYITTYQDRIILLPSENPNQWWYSKQNIPGAPVEFTDSFVNNVDQAGGPLVSALKMDSELVLFKQTLPYYVTGVGPDSTGNQNDFSAAIAITADVGCVDKDSPVLVPGGIIFKSLKGLYLLNRGLQMSYIGADVEVFNSSDVVSANLIEDTQQVRFCLNSGVALLYDYYVNNWSVFTNHPAVDSIIFQGEFTYITALGQVLKETPGQFTDNGEFIKLKLVTSWLSFVGLQAFQRVYQMLFLGDYFNPHNVAVYAAYDFNPFPTQQNVTQAGNILGTGVYGSDATYGETSPYGGPPQTYQFRVNLNRQKCETIQITIEDNQLGASFGENLALSAFGFVVGTKGSLNKIVAQGSNTSMP